MYLSTQLAKDPSQTVHVKINRKVIKCCFAQDMERNKIGMSKILRTFIGTDVGLAVTVEPLSQEY